MSSFWSVAGVNSVHQMFQQGVCLMLLHGFTPRMSRCPEAAALLVLHVFYKSFG